MKLKHLAFALLFSAVIISCSDDSSSDSPLVPPSSANTFWASDFSTNTYYQTPAVFYKSGTHCEIYIEEASRYSVSDTDLDDIIREFDNNIYGLVTSKIGSESDVDSNGKITLFILDVKDGFSGTGGYVAGYYDSTNVLSVYASNNSDMIYLDCYPSNPSSLDFRQTIAHEFQHLVNFNMKGISGEFSQDTWINEGLSSAVEYIYSGAHLASRISYYNDYQTARSWGDNFYRWTNELIDYSTVYMFFQWLRIHSDDGDAIYKDIMDSSYTDYRAVVEQLESHSSLYNGIAINSISWTDIMIDWLVANQINKATGKHGYSGEITGLTKMQSSNESGYSYTVAAPYEGLVKSLTANYTPGGSSGSHITFIGFDENETFDDTIPYGDDLTGTKYLIGLNDNIDFTGTYEKVYLPASIKSKTEASTAFFDKPLIYRIDVIPGQTSLPSKDVISERKMVLESLK